MLAVQFDSYGHSDVLEIREVEERLPREGQVTIAVVDAGLNPGEIAIREGATDGMFPAHFPEGQGSDLAGIVTAVGEGVETFAVGDRVIGMSDERSAQAQFVTIDAERVVHKPAALDWPQAASLYVAGTTATACVRAVGAGPGDTVLVSGAAGGVGSLAAQLARRAGARVVGVASHPNHDALVRWGVLPIEYGDGLADRIRRLVPEGVDAVIDTHGGGYVDLAVELGVAPERIDTIIDFAAAEEHGVKTDGQSAIDDPDIVVDHLAHLIAQGELELPVRAAFPFTQVRDAYDELENGHGLGKIVLNIGTIA